MRLAPLYQEDREQARLEGKLEGKFEGLLEGKLEGEQQIIIKLLNRRLGEIEISLIEQIKGLSSDELEVLSDVLLDFSKIDDLQTWLNEKSST
ncbi:MAG: DUF4351 domain-containing protein [Sphaerospermopsis sp. SIO1G2]|nr:DUF4351 domain-containing protein [Sphaerospermopsis sp. SIO1G2]